MIVARATTRHGNGMHAPDYIETNRRMCNATAEVHERGYVVRLCEQVRGPRGLRRAPAAQLLADRGQTLNSGADAVQPGAIQVSEK